MLGQFISGIEHIKNMLIVMYPEKFRGYGFSNGKGGNMTKLRRNAQAELRTHAQWAKIEAQEKKQQEAVERARQLIKWAQGEYDGAKRRHQGSIKIFAELTLNWSAPRVLSTHKDFGRLCDALKDETTWRLLNRKERMFIADAVAHSKEAA